MENRKDELIKLIFAKYNSLLLSKKEASTIIGKSIVSLDRMKARGQGPEYIKDEGAKNATVFYPIDKLAEWVVSQQTQKTL